MTSWRGRFATLLSGSVLRLSAINKRKRARHVSQRESGEQHLNALQVTKRDEDRKMRRWAVWDTSIEEVLVASLPGSTPMARPNGSVGVTRGGAKPWQLHALNAGDEMPFSGTTRMMPDKIGWGAVKRPDMRPAALPDREMEVGGQHRKEEKQVA
jgi:hypothetical protein